MTSRLRPILHLAAALLAACSAPPQRESVEPPREAAPVVPPHEAAVRAWYWLGTVDAGGLRRVEQPTRYRIEFADSRTLLLVADCNRGRAAFVWSLDGRFETGPAGLTKMGCAQGSLDREFLAGLARPAILHATGEWLWLESHDGGHMLFGAADTLRLARHACGPRSLAVAFGTTSAVLLLDGRVHVLAARPGSGGEVYGDAAARLRVRGGSLEFESAGAAHACRADG